MKQKFWNWVKNENEGGTVMAWNHIIENREHFMEKWYEQMESDDLLISFKARQFIKLMENAASIKNMDLELMLKTLNNIKVFEDGMLLVRFMEGTEIECKSEGKLEEMPTGE